MLEHQSSGMGGLRLIGVLVAWSLFPAIAIAQITPDGSLGTERSQVSRGVVQGAPAELINVGAQ